MFGKKSQQIRDLERLVRVRTAERDEAQEDLRATRYAARRAAELVNEQQAAPAVEATETDVEHSELWSLIDWSLWGSGMGDTFRERLADQFIRAITPEQHAQALRLMQAWTNSGRTTLGRRRYEDQHQRLHRALRGCARARADEAKLARRLALVQSQYDNAVGLDHPDLDAGADWQTRRKDPVR